MPLSGKQGAEDGAKSQGTGPFTPGMGCYASTCVKTHLVATPITYLFLLLLWVLMHTPAKQGKANS